MVAPMYQVATLQSLTRGDFYSNCTVGDLLEHGDTGLGTFAAVDGEMIIIDGKCYRARADGSVSPAVADDGTPFAVATFLAKSIRLKIKGGSDMQQLLDCLEQAADAAGSNNIYACRIDGSFKAVYARSEMKQEHEPYKTFAQVLATDQREFHFNDVDGSLIGVYFPQYMAGLNMPGWHIHFISEDRTMGGHVFGLTVKQAQGYMGKTDGFTLKIPDSEYFQKLNLAEVSKAEIESVEKAGK